MNKRQTNFCKGIAVILLLIHHLFGNYEDIENFSVICTPLSGESLAYLAQIFKVCVSIFVFLTGYGYMKSSQKMNDKVNSTYGEVTCKRYIRLMFGFWFIFIPALIINFVAGENVYGNGRLERCTNILIDGLGLAHVFQTPTINVTWWYMSYALLLVLITPFFIWLIEKTKLMIIPITIIVPRFLIDIDAIGNPHFITRYLLALILGIICAKYYFFERAAKISKKILYADIWLFLLLCVAIGIFRQRIGYFDISEAFLAMIICYLTVRIIPQEVKFWRILAFIGKHSLNIFLIHTFIFKYYFSDFVYSFKYAGLITIVLLVISLFLSILIEQLKKILAYNKLENFVLKKIYQLYEREDVRTGKEIGIR